MVAPNTAALALVLITPLWGAAQTSSREPFPAGFAPCSRFGDLCRVDTVDPGVQISMNTPPVEAMGRDKTVDLILYALPNGNSTAWTAGKSVTPQDDWHYDIQHIAAQTRYLRAVLPGRLFVVVYLEATPLSWPRWRTLHPEGGKIIAEIVAYVRAQFMPRKTLVTLTGHSGGGSFTFGYLNAMDTIPGWVRRISFLDSNYGYADSSGHGEKLQRWLGGDTTRVLSVIAYDDRRVTLEGKPIVSPTGGTFRSTHRMLDRFARSGDLRQVRNDSLALWRGYGGCLEFLIHTNPRVEILHTQLVGDMNGFIHAITIATPSQQAGEFGGPRKYLHWVE
jgi:hypothetical protein